MHVSSPSLPSHLLGRRTATAAGPLAMKHHYSSAGQQCKTHRFQNQPYDGLLFLGSHHGLEGGRISAVWKRQILGFGDVEKLTKTGSPILDIPNQQLFLGNMVDDILIVPSKTFQQGFFVSRLGHTTSTPQKGSPHSFLNHGVIKWSSRTGEMVQPPPQRRCRSNGIQDALHPFLFVTDAENDLGGRIVVQKFLVIIASGNICRGLVSPKDGIPLKWWWWFFLLYRLPPCLVVA